MARDYLDGRASMTTSYAVPQLQRLGTLRDLTQSFCDFLEVLGVDCAAAPESTAAQSGSTPEWAPRGSA